MHPVVLEMDCDEIRAALASEEPGAAVVELPLVERQITTVAFDHGQVAA